MNISQLVPFKDYGEFIDVLTKKAATYPLIRKLYIPIIEDYAKEYPEEKFDAILWLLIPYFQCLYFNNNDRLHEIEKILNQIYKALGEQEFDEMCNNLLEFVRNPSINGIYDKLLDFYGELSGMLYFIRKGYQIKRIERKSGEKTADFLLLKIQNLLL